MHFLMHLRELNEATLSSVSPFHMGTDGIGTGLGIGGNNATIGGGGLQAGTESLLGVGFGAQVRQASREAALREIKDRQKKMKADKAKAAKSAPKGKPAKAAPQKMRK